MKLLKVCLLACLLNAGAVFASAPSDASIKQLLEVAQARKLVDNVMAQMDGMMKSFMQEGLKGPSPSPTEQKAIDNMQRKMAELYRQEMSWERLEPLYIRLYRETFSQDEVDGMVAFYRTPAGQALVTKMPVLMQKTMAEMQPVVAGLMPKVEVIQREFIMETRASRK